MRASTRIAVDGTNLCKEIAADPPANKPGRITNTVADTDLYRSLSTSLLSPERFFLPKT